MAFSILRGPAGPTFGAPNTAGGGGTAPTITTTSLSSGIEGVAYSQTLTATGTAPITWSITSGSISPLTLNSSTGAITGTPSTATTLSATFRATNAYGTNDKALSIVVNAAGAAFGIRPQIYNGSLSRGLVGSAYSQTITATGAAPVTFSLVSGSLPAGLTLNGTSGVISGTPSATAAASCIFRASNAYGYSDWTLEINIDASVAPTILTAAGAFPNGMVGLAYSTKLIASESNKRWNYLVWSIPAGSYTVDGSDPGNQKLWTWTGGGLPSGLSMSGVGVISGTPSATATAAAISFTARNTNSNLTSTLSKTITVAASDGTSTAPVITTTDNIISPSTVGTAYSYTLAATGTAPLTWSILQGTLDSGLTLNSSTGAITGTPVTAGPVSLIYQVRNSASCTIKEIRLTRYGTPTVISAPIIKVWRSVQ